jgi:hypothetical protein
MEVVMLGHKRAAPLWRRKRKRPLLPQERALSPSRSDRTDKQAAAEQEAIAVKAAQYAAIEARWQAWLRGHL